ncbi:MAG: tRNA (adenosine(37)-N6)-threonylcarbamoyltransferase complex ATPase subunit type 1 TsaE [Gemmatimonadales bacterium]
MTEPGVGRGKLCSLDEMRCEAESLARELQAGAVVWLTGEVGSGKTTFVQALAGALGVEHARSPTFSLVNEYEGAGTLIHVDCYRLKAPAEAIDLDFPDLTRRASVLAIEWPERGGRFVPMPDVHLAFGHTADPNNRILERVR